MTTVDPEKPTPGGDGAVSAGSLAYYTWLDHDQLMKRLGTYVIMAWMKGVWLRSGSKNRAASNFGFKINILIMN